MTKDKEFGKKLRALMIPIALQNLMLAAVSAGDSAMLGFVDETAMSAVSLAGNIQFIENLFLYAVIVGGTIMTAQYWGKGDIGSAEKVLAIGTKISIACSALFFIAVVFFPTLVMRIYTNDPGMIEAGAQYLRVVGFSYLFMGFSQPYLSALKCIEKVKESTLINSTALVLNIVLNATFIFGWIPGIPPLGIFGVALATVIARAVEFILCIIVGERIKSLRLRPRLFTLHSKVLTHDFIQLALPALGNDVIWSLAFSAYSVIMGHLGEDLVAANSIVSTMRNLVSTFGFGVASGTAIILGNIIGSGDLKLAEKNAGRLLWLTFLTSLMGSFLILCCHPIVPLIKTLTPQAAEYLHTMIWISSVYVIGGPMNTFLICGIFRAGGDSKFGFYCDVITMWAVFVPLGFIAAFLLNLPPMIVYLILSCDEFAKMPFVFRHYFKKGWLRDITKENTN